MSQDEEPECLQEELRTLRRNISRENPELNQQISHLQYLQIRTANLKRSIKQRMKKREAKKKKREKQKLKNKEDPS